MLRKLRIAISLEMGRRDQNSGGLPVRLVYGGTGGACASTETSENRTVAVWPGNSNGFYGVLP
jgi:hypothetical protein